MRRAWVLVAWVLVAACGDNRPGADGGTPDGGPPDGSTGTGDGGLGVACSLAAQDCPEAHSCMPMEAGNGAREPRCVAGACDVVAQGCAGGQKCGYALDGGTAARTCVPPPEGARAEGESCTTGGPSIDTCAAGLLCAGFQQEDGGVAQVQCRRFCYTNEGCSASQVCGLAYAAPGSAERPGLCLEVQTCDPLVQDCPAPDACYLSGSRSICARAGSTPPGGACTAANDCAPGATCIEDRDSGARTCRAFCNPTDGGTPACSEGRCHKLENASAGVCLP